MKFREESLKKTNKFPRGDVQTQFDAPELIALVHHPLRDFNQLLSCVLIPYTMRSDNVDSVCLPFILCSPLLTQLHFLSRYLLANKRTDETKEQKIRLKRKLKPSTMNRCLSDEK